MRSSDLPEKKTPKTEDKPLRPVDRDYLYLPTREEVIEGHCLSDFRQCPTEKNRIRYIHAWNLLSATQGSRMALGRCPDCLALKFGRSRNHPCGNCGETSGMEYEGVGGSFVMLPGTFDAHEPSVYTENTNKGEVNE